MKNTKKVPSYLKVNSFYLEDSYYESYPKEKNKGYLYLNIPKWDDEISSAFETLYPGVFSEISVKKTKDNRYTLVQGYPSKSNLLSAFSTYKVIESVLSSVYNKNYTSEWSDIENSMIYTLPAPPSKIRSITFEKETLTK